MIKYFLKSSLGSRILSLVVLAIVVGIPVLAAVPASASVNAKFSLSSSSQTVTTGNDIIIYLNLDTGGNSVLAWKTTINYSTTAFSSANVATDTSSHFTLNPGTDTAANGTIKLARYATSSSSVSGPMAKITLHASGVGSSSLTFAHICSSTSDASQCSAVTDSSGANLLSTLTNATYTVAAVPVAAAATKKKSVFSKVADAIAAVVGPTTSASTTKAVSSRGTVQIKVTNQKNKPIEGAKVTLAGVSGKTDKNGLVILKGLYPGEAKGSISYKDKTQSISLYIESGTTENAPQAVTFSIKTQSLSLAVKLLLAAVGIIMLIGIIDLAFISKGGFKADVNNLFHHGTNQGLGKHDSTTPGSIIRPSSAK
jgi:hypothetical protein